MSTKKKEEEGSVFTSQVLECALADSELKSSYVVPQSAAVEHISEATTGMKLPEEKDLVPKDVGLNVGLGIKRKMMIGSEGTEGSGGPPDSKKSRVGKKAKTLSEKREMLERDILKYGLTAIEKIYPRQKQRLETSKADLPSGKRRQGPRIKMKAKPSGSEEIDAQQILRPYSHAKYIQQPEYRSVVYIRRRRDMVPLSSLSKDARTVLSSDAKLLSGRNVSYGRPSLFVREQGRVIAIGGSRNKENDSSLQIIPVPNIKSRLSRSQSSLDFIPFYMDEEFASFAVGTVKVPKKKPKVDIRTLKRIQRRQSTDLKRVLENKSIVDHVFEKMELGEETEVKKEEEEGLQQPEEEIKVKKEEEEGSQQPEKEIKVKTEEEVDDDELPEEGSSRKLYNRLLDSSSSFVNPLPDPEGCPVTSSEFQFSLKERNNKDLSGYEACDIEDCFCRCVFARLGGNSSPCTDGTQTPESNVPTPMEREGQHVVKNLKKVRRALKTLGVNLVEFDAQKDCDKDFCRLGCVCETLRGSPVLPNHCSKVECMFRCLCSEETLKKLSSSRKVAISPSSANFQDKSPPNVVTTGGRDLIMISGRQKRERKMPTRYQDTDALTIESSAASDLFSSKPEDFFDLDNILVPGKEDPNIVKMISKGINEGISNKCTVLVPRINLNKDVKPWCMFHCQHSCPCFKYENPLDFGPDLSKRNVARRSSKFTKSPVCLKEEKEENTEDSKVYPVHSDQCARTEGILINPSMTLKMPHKFITKKESLDIEIKGDIIKFRLPKEEKKTLINLSLKPNKSLQYIHWHVLHFIFTEDIARIWHFTRKGKTVFYITRFSSPPYNNISSCLKELITHTSDTSILPTFAKELLATKEGEKAPQKFAILTSSGLAWEITGILQKKAHKPSQPSTGGKATINLDLNSQRLSPGVSIITVVQADKALMQIKLPDTATDEYWCSLKVSVGVESVPCPEGSVTLKTSAISHAVILANNENKTVRVPIENSSSGSSAFGIYAVPCLDKHVFVGPYISREIKEVDPEVIVLDEEEEDSAPVKSTPCRRKQKLTTKFDEFDRMNNEVLMSNLVEKVANKAVAFGEKRRKKELHSQQAVLGPVPEIVRVESQTEAVWIVEEEAEKKRLQSEALKASIKESMDVIPAYQNLPKSTFGRIVRGRIEKKESQIVLITSGHEAFKAYFVSPRKIVQFAHPSISFHIVMCKDVDNARKWMDEYKERVIEANSKKQKTSPSPPSSSPPPPPRPEPKSNHKHLLAIKEREHQEYVHLFFKLRKSLTPDYDISNMYSRIQVIDLARTIIHDYRKKIATQEALKKQLLDRRSDLFDEFTCNLKGLPLDVKKQFVYNLKVGLKPRQQSEEEEDSPEHRCPQYPKAPPPPKKGGSQQQQNMPALIPILPDENEQESISSSSPPTETVVNKFITSPPPPPPNTEGDKTRKRKPLNAFMLWAKKQRPQLVSSGLSTVELSRMLVDRWHQLSQKERLVFQQEAERLKASNSEPSELKATIKQEDTERSKMKEEVRDSIIVPSSREEEEEPPTNPVKPPIIEISLD